MRGTLYLTAPWVPGYKNIRTYKEH